MGRPSREAATRTMIASDSAPDDDQDDPREVDDAVHGLILPAGCDSEPVGMRTTANRFLTGVSLQPHPGRRYLGRMRLAALILLVLGLSATVATGAAKAPGGTLPIEDGRGTVQITGKGVLVGRMEKGSLEIVDLNPTDQWSPRVNGIPRGKVVTLRGKNVSFYVPGGRYRLVARGTGISISARGTGTVVLDGDPDAVGDTGRYAIGDAASVPLPVGNDQGVLREGRGERAVVPISQDPAMTAPQTILVVEDETAIASFVALYLKNAGYNVKAVGTGGAALNAIAAEAPALILLDLNLPDMDGLEICRRVRKSSDVPILMLTARDEDVDKIIGLEVGADDYLTKPFNPRELVARVKSVLRRSSTDRRRDEGDEIRHGDLVINAGRREAMVGDREIQLAPKEFDLLWELLDHRGIVLTRDQLLERVWGYTFAGRHAHRRRARAADPPQARGRLADRDRVGRRLQGRPGSHLRARGLTP